jgi:hypothetical protein
MDESGQEAETRATVSLEIEAVKAKEKEIAARKKEYDEDKIIRTQAIRVFERYADIFPLTKQRVNFLQK